MRTAWGFATLGVLGLALAVGLVRRRHKDCISNATVARWVGDWRGHALERDGPKFDAIVERYLRAGGGGVTSAVAALGRRRIWH